MKTDLLTAKKNHIFTVVLLIVMAVQVSMIWFWTMRKTNLFADELLSFGYAHSYTFDREDVVYIYETSDWEYETWVDNRALRDHLEVSEEESLLSQPPLTALSLLLNGRNYFGILNLLMSVLAPDSISIYPGVLLNILLFVVSQLLTYRIAKEMSGSCYAALFAVVMYGFSTMAVSITIFIRFYSLVTALFLGVIRLHQIMWRTKKPVVFELLTAASMALCFLAMKNSELVFILTGALIVSFSLTLLGKGQYRKALWYLLTTVPAGLYYAIKKTYYLDILLHPANYTEKKWPVDIMTNSVLGMTPAVFVSNAKKQFGVVATSLVGSRYLCWGFAGVLLIMLGIRLARREKDPPEPPEDKCRRGCFWVILGTTAIYLLFAILTASPVNRYLSFVFPLISILLWCGIALLASDNAVRNWAFLLCAALTVCGAVLQQAVHHNYSYFYPGDKEAVEAVEDSGVQDTIFVFSDVFAGEHAIYDFVNLLPDTARVYPVDKEHDHVDADKCPDDLLIWTYKGTEIDAYVEELTSGAFQITRIGRTHASDIYLAQRITETK